MAQAMEAVASGNDVLLGSIIKLMGDAAFGSTLKEFGDYALAQWVEGQAEAAAHEFARNGEASPYRPEHHDHECPIFAAHRVFDAVLTAGLSAGAPQVLAWESAWEASTAVCSSARSHWER